MVNPDRTKLSGLLQVDETYVSAGRVRPTKGRGGGKPVVVCAVEVKDKTAGRVRLRRIEDATEESLKDFIEAHIDKGSTLVTDGWKGYFNVKQWGYRHIVKIGETSVDVAKQLIHVHRVFSNLKAWLIGTHHGVSSKHLQAYLNEFTFRYNRRKNPQAAFLAVLGISSHRGGPTYSEIYNAGEESGGWIHPNPLGVSE